MNIQIPDGNMLIVIIGGLMLMVFAFMIFRSGPAPKAPEKEAKPIKQPKAERPAADKQESGSAEKRGPKLNSLSAGLKNISRLKSVLQRGNGKKEPPPAAAPEPVAETADSSHMPDLSSLGLKNNDLQALANRESPNLVPEPEMEVEPEADDAVESEAGPESVPAEDIAVDTTDAVPAFEEETEHEMDLEMEAEAETDESVPAEEEESADASETEEEMLVDSPDNDIESSEEAENEEPANPIEEMQQEQSAPAQGTKSDNLFDMFKEEAVVESDASKFAKQLDDVDVHDLLEESQNLINYLSGHWRR